LEGLGFGLLGFTEFDKELFEKIYRLTALVRGAETLKESLGVELYTKTIFVFVVADKNDDQEDVHLAVMEEFVKKFVEKCGYKYELLYRNTLKRDRVDGVRIHI